MDEEDILDEEVLDTEPEGSPAERTDEELPDDPDSLKVLLRQERTEKAEARREVKAATRRIERLEDDLSETKVKADYWSAEAQKQQASSGGETPKPGAIRKPTNSLDAIKEAVKGMDMAKYVADQDDGVANFVEDLAKRKVIITPDEAERMLDDKLNQRDEQQQQAQRLYGNLTNQYPDLNDSESELAQETLAGYERLIKENPSLKGPLGSRIAAAEAAAMLGIQPKTKAAPKTTAKTTDNTRIRTAQGGPRSTQPTPTARSVQLNENDKRIARQMGLTDDQALKSKQRAQRQLQEHQRAQRQRA